MKGAALRKELPYERSRTVSLLTTFGIYFGELFCLTNPNNTVEIRKSNFKLVCVILTTSNFQQMNPFKSLINYLLCIFTELLTIVHELQLKGI